MIIPYIFLLDVNPENKDSILKELYSLYDVLSIVRDPCIDSIEECELIDKVGGYFKFAILDVKTLEWHYPQIDNNDNVLVDNEDLTNYSNPFDTSYNIFKIYKTEIIKYLKDFNDKSILSCTYITDGIICDNFNEKITSLEWYLKSHKTCLYYAKGDSAFLSELSDDFFSIENLKDKLYSFIKREIEFYRHRPYLINWQEKLEDNCDWCTNDSPFEQEELSPTQPRERIDDWGNW